MKGFFTAPDYQRSCRKMFNLTNQEFRETELLLGAYMAFLKYGEEIKISTMKQDWANKISEFDNPELRVIKSFPFRFGRNLFPNSDTVNYALTSTEDFLRDRSEYQNYAVNNQAGDEKEQSNPMNLDDD